MSSINKAMLIGHLGRDPETRYLTNGDAVTNFSIATTDRWKDKTSGEAKETTEWHRIVTFGKLAEIAGEYLKKGSHVFIEGKIQTRKYEDKEGIERYVTEIRANELKFLSRAPGGDDADERSTPSRPQQERKPAGKPPAKTASKTTGFEDMPDDLPFLFIECAFMMEPRKLSKVRSVRRGEETVPYLRPMEGPC